MMGSLLAGLASLAQPMVARVLMALGFTVLTISGVAVAVSELKGYVVDGLGAMPLAAIQLGGLLGLWEGIGMVFGAATFAVSLWTLTKAVRIAGAG